MKCHTLLTAALALLASSACISLYAQAPAPSGTYGFLAGVQQIDSQGDVGGAVLGLVTFDGSGGVSGNVIIKPRSLDPAQIKPFPVTLTGTYAGNPDGSGTVTMNFQDVFTSKLAIAPAGGGSYNLLSLDCAPCGADIPLRVVNGTLNGSLPMAPFLTGATGAIPLVVPNVTKDIGGPTALVYAVNGSVGTGPATCPDGSTGTWAANAPNVTLVMNGSAGNFLAAVGGSVCGGDPNITNVSGLVYTNFAANGDRLLVLHAVTGGVAKGTARVAGGDSLNGAYGFKLDYQPYPFGTLGLMNFDGAGNVTQSATNSGGTGNPGTAQFTGTYTINPDSTGTITLKNATGLVITYAIVLTDGGSQFHMLRTDNNPGFNLAYGSATLLQ